MLNYMFYQRPTNGRTKVLERVKSIHSAALKQTHIVAYDKRSEPFVGHCTESLVDSNS